jgi:hypothetical protein
LDGIKCPAPNAAGLETSASMLPKRTRTPEQILDDSERKRDRMLPYYLEEYVVFKLIVWFVEWIGVKRFFFLAFLLGAIVAYAYGSITIALVMLFISLAFAIGMFVDADDDV